METNIERAGEILEAMAATFKERSSAYKGNREVAANMFQSMFPKGVSLTTAFDHERFHILSLIVVKLSRYAVNFETGGHQDSIHDAAVYCAILEGVDEKAQAPALKVK